MAHPFSQAIKDQAFEKWLLLDCNAIKTSNDIGICLPTIRSWVKGENWHQRKSERMGALVATMHQQPRGDGERVTATDYVTKAKNEGIRRQLEVIKQADDISKKALNLQTKIMTVLDQLTGEDFMAVESTNVVTGASSVRMSKAGHTLKALCESLATLAKVHRPNNDILTRLTGIEVYKKPSPEQIGGVKIQNAVFQVGMRPTRKATTTDGELVEPRKVLNEP